MSKNSNRIQLIIWLVAFSMNCSICKFIFKSFISFLYSYVCMCACTDILRDRRGYQILWGCCYRAPVRHLIWVLEAELGSSEITASTLNCSTIFAAPHFMNAKAYNFLYLLCMQSGMPFKTIVVRKHCINYWYW